MLIAHFTPRDRGVVTITRGEESFSASITAVYTDHSAFIVREPDGRISIIRSKNNGWWLAGRPVEIESGARGFNEEFERGLQAARERLANQGLWPAPWETR
jgi:hypothetical protein